MEIDIKESPMMLFSSNANQIHHISYIMETVEKESPIISYSANPESPIMETAKRNLP
jgi:hypothetical protein